MSVINMLKLAGVNSIEAGKDGWILNGLDPKKFILFNGLDSSGIPKDISLYEFEPSTANSVFEFKNYMNHFFVYYDSQKETYDFEVWYNTTSNIKSLTKDPVSFRDNGYTKEDLDNAGIKVNIII